MPPTEEQFISLQDINLSAFNIITEGGAKIVNPHAAGTTLICTTADCPASKNCPTYQRGIDDTAFLSGERYIAPRLFPRRPKKTGYFRHAR